MGNTGRQSPLLLRSKITNSPLVRRVRKTSTKPSSNLVRKSISMDNMSVNNPEKLITSCEDYLTEKTGESADLAIGEECAVTASLDKVGNPESNLKELGMDTKFNEVSARVDDNFSASYSTLPRSLSRTRNVSRSIVPKMRKFFEKSRSCDPELPQVKITIHNNPNNGNTRGSHSTADGTES